MYKLISCWVFIIMFCLFFVGSLGFAQGSDSKSSGWEKRSLDSEQPLGIEKKGQENKDKWNSMSGEVEATKEEMKAETEKAKEAKVKAEKDAKAKVEKAERGAIKEERQKYFWEFWK